MRGTRPLTDQEYHEVLTHIRGKNSYRTRALFILGCKSGFRISEMLSLTVGDVWQKGKMVARVTVRRSSMKGKNESRTILLHPEASEALQWLIEENKLFDKPKSFIFLSQKGGNKPISRIQAFRDLAKVFEVIGLEGKLGTHCMRKTFANKMYDRLGHDLIKLQKAMGHKNVNSTAQYLSFREEEIDEAILDL